MQIAPELALIHPALLNVLLTSALTSRTFAELMHVVADSASDGVFTEVERQKLRVEILRMRTALDRLDTQVGQ